MGAIEIPNFVNAAATIVPVVAAPFTTEIVQGRGVASFTRLSAGQYEIVLEVPLGFQEAIPRVSVPANQRFICGAQIVSPGLVRVSCFSSDTGLPDDPDAVYFTTFAIVEGEGVGPQLPLAPVPPPIPTGGDVVGPASSTDNAIARWDGTTGKLLQNSLVTISDLGAVAGALTYNGAKILGEPPGGNFILGDSLALSQVTTGIANLAIGYWSLQRLTTGTSNIAVGSAAGNQLVTGTDNTFVGTLAGFNATGSKNTLIGRFVGSALTTGSRNIIIGETAVAFEGAAGNDSLNIGGTILGDLANRRVRIGAPASLATQTSVLRVDNVGADTVPVLELASLGSNGAITKVRSGTRNPDGVVSGNAGDLYTRKKGATSTLYVNVSVTDPGTAWMSVSDFVGLTREQRSTTVVVTLTALGGTAAISGPAAGFVRVIQSPCINASDSVSALATTIVLNPGAFPLGTAATQAILFNTVQIPVLGPGETLNITNGSASAAQLTYSYYDIPDTGITLVRQRFSNVPVTIVPAPAAGFWRRVLLVGGTAGQASKAAFSTAVPYNCDTAPVKWGFTLGAAPMGFSTAATISMSGNPLPVPGLPSVTVTAATGDLKISTLAAVATAQNTYFGAYETFPD